MPAADDFLARRKQQTEERFRRVQDGLRSADSLLGDFATVYVTGSYGRVEASDHSDLDLFILTDSDDEGKPRLKALNTIRLQAALIDVVDREQLPPFSDEGGYLGPHSIEDMIEKLGGRDDDYENLFTARMLLLLESRPLLGSTFYDRAIDRVLAEYWRDYPQNAERFLPIYLTNDLIRYWKVLCLNYEANTRNAENQNKRRLNNYKLKHSRLLTCYSALVYFCHLLRRTNTITVEAAREMTKLTPTERLQSLRSDGAVAALVDEILDRYVEFLESTDAPKDDLLARFSDPSYRGIRRESGQNFGDLMFDLLEKIGSKSRLFRYLVV
jgi:predicted nucleotidyltransferase